MSSRIYLIPTTLGHSDLDLVLPSGNKKIVCELKHFIVEDIRSARRFLKQVEKSINIDELFFYELNEHSKHNDLIPITEAMRKKLDLGIISEAGCPVVADPGADAVTLAHRFNYKVIPLSGPSSILMALMASGFLGQNFAFSGYLPIKPNERGKDIKKLENRAYSEGQTQIFMEAPYRNNKLMEQLIATLRPDTRLCYATDISLETEEIKMRTVKDWKKPLPNLHKRPTIFVISAG